MGRISKTHSLEKSPILFLTCEHAGNEIPAPYRRLFSKSRGVLATHRGWDPGAFEIARGLQKLSRGPFYFTKVSRLIVDMNRSIESSTLLSKWSSALEPNERSEILNRYYFPYRFSIETAVARSLKKNRVAHFGIHSFSPYLDPSRRSCHIGILFDPKHSLESEIAKRLLDSLQAVFPKLGIHLNFPYRGDADGLTTDLRKRHRSSKGAERYAGLEIEFNQAYLKKLAKQKSTGAFTRLFHFALENSLSESNSPLPNR